MSKMPTVRKPTKWVDPLTISTQQNYCDSSTNIINRKRALLEYRDDLLNEEITELDMKLADARANKTRILAEIAGLTLILSKR